MIVITIAFILLISHYDGASAHMQDVPIVYCTTIVKFVEMFVDGSS